MFCSNEVSHRCREKTGAHRRLEDDVEPAVKVARHLALKDVYRAGLGRLLSGYVGQQLTVLVTGPSKRSDDDLQGMFLFLLEFISSSNLLFIKKF